MRRRLQAGAACALLAALAVGGLWYALGAPRGQDEQPLNVPARAPVPFQIDQPAGMRIRRPIPDAERRWQATRDFTLWIDPMPEEVGAARQSTGDASNIHPDDYAGPDACRECHRQQYEAWLTHAHRWMNARADATTVKGDFSGRSMSYLGGEISMLQVENSYRMRLSRGDVQREYVVDQTIGSRFFQYYTGRQLSGPEPADHPLYRESHVLPIGYWLAKKEWVPAVHVHDDKDFIQHDPYAVRAWDPTAQLKYVYDAHDLYRANCNFCHTTFPLGDMLVRFHDVLGQFPPTVLDLSLEDYAQRARPELWPVGKFSEEITDDEFVNLLQAFRGLDAPTHAVTLGVSCEACHLGSRQHAQGKWRKPLFHPKGPELAVRTKMDKSGRRLEHDFGRTHDNINWACGRCHTGKRPQYAAGMSTWNSTEYSDAMRGSCYSQLTCIRCHPPHETLGAGWSRTAVEDDAICLECHQKFEPDESRIAHTHHPLGSEGARCMNCHMPRLNEGLQAVVRTHMIFSPTNAAMIEANHPNACNQCHADQSIDWTLTRLQEWYGATYAEDKIRVNYPNRTGPAALGWLRSDNEAVRLVAADVLCRSSAEWALPDLLNMLDDPFTLNRQFTRMGLESMLRIELRDFGYEFHMTPDERKQPIENLKARLLRSDQ